MATRTWVLVTLLATAALAGCTSSNDDAPATGAPAAPPPAEEPAPAPETAPPPPPATTTPRPADFEFADGGSIQGPFEQTWEIEVESLIYREARVLFTLDGLQPGSPPTARVNLALVDPSGATLRSATLGLGGEGNVADWPLAPGDLPAKGTYRLVATPGSEAPLPSMGAATYGVHITIDY